MTQRSIDIFISVLRAVVSIMQVNVVSLGFKFRPKKGQTKWFVMIFKLALF